MGEPRTGDFKEYVVEQLADPEIAKAYMAEILRIMQEDADSITEFRAENESLRTRLGEADAVIAEYTAGEGPTALAQEYLDKYKEQP